MINIPQSFLDIYSHLQYNELPKVRKLNPDRYILGVSADFEPEQKEKLIDLFKGYIINTSDIYLLNMDMLKNGRQFGRDYFAELLEKIREIRASERRAYQKIADVFEQCGV